MTAPLEHEPAVTRAERLAANSAAGFFPFLPRQELWACPFCQAVSHMAHPPRYNSPQCVCTGKPRALLRLSDLEIRLRKEVFEEATKGTMDAPLYHE